MLASGATVTSEEVKPANREDDRESLRVFYGKRTEASLGQTTNALYLTARVQDFSQ